MLLLRILVFVWLSFSIICNKFTNWLISATSCRCVHSRLYSCWYIKSLPQIRCFYFNLETEHLLYDFSHFIHNFSKVLLEFLFTCLPVPAGLFCFSHWANRFSLNLHYCVHHERKVKTNPHIIQCHEPRDEVFTLNCINFYIWKEVFGFA